MNLGMPEMIFIFLLALIIFGPRKLPEIGRQLGRALSEFKRASNEFQAQLEDEIRQIENLEHEQRSIQPPAVTAAAPTAAPPTASDAPQGTIAREATASSSDGASSGNGTTGSPANYDHLTAAQGHDG